MKEEIEYIICCCINLLKKRLKMAHRLEKFLPSEVFENTVGDLKNIMSEFDNLEKQMDINCNCHNTFGKLRLLMSKFSSLVISSDYQSPSDRFSLYSNAGLQTGKIISTMNDYKRDVHLDEYPYETAFIKEYIDAGFKIWVRAFMTSSGMSAFSTVISYLSGEGKAKGCILCGENSYFQYKALLDKYFRGRIGYFNEDDFANLSAKVKKYKPSCIFIDSIGNSSKLPLPDIGKIIRLLLSEKRKIYLVIDNTGMSIFCQPFILAPFDCNLRVITFESLMKYHHFGLDRATGGIVICGAKDAGGLFEYRKNTGSNISDYNVYCFPTPNRKLLKNRMLALSSNAQYLVSRLDDFLLKNKTPLNKIIFPKGNHPFKGSYFVLDFKKQYRSVSFYKKFIGNVIQEAKKEKVQVIEGTSFGLNTTRIMLTSLWTDYGEPFIRVSAGREDEETVRKIAGVFQKALTKSNSFMPKSIMLGINTIKKKLKVDKFM